MTKVQALILEINKLDQLGLEMILREVFIQNLNNTFHYWPYNAPVSS
jgi:hypothetical protein